MKEKDESLKSGSFLEVVVKEEEGVMIKVQESEEEEESGNLFHFSDEMDTKEEMKPDPAVPDGMELIVEEREAAIVKRLDDHTVN
jgi:bifunctional DNA-binding transcriptional regulator/antitoxin component of YhaV-PrlF toxin-antitoxin module